MIKIDENLTFCETTHTYYLRGREVPSPTQCLEEAGITNYWGIKGEVLDRAQAFGRCAHKITEIYDNAILKGLPTALVRGWEETMGKDPTFAPLLPYLQGWKDFLNNFDCEVVAIEKPVYSIRLRSAGTLDRVVGRRGSLILIDIKTGTEIHPAVAFQTAAYQKMWEEMRLGKITERICVRLFENGYQREVFKSGTDLEVFKSALFITNVKRERKIR